MNVKGLKAHVRREKFAIAKVGSEDIPPNSFVTIDDGNEITVVVKETDMKSILCYSSYSTDHLLVKEKDVSEAVTALKGLGVVIQWK